MLLKQQRQLIATGLVTQEQISDAMQGNGGKKVGLLLSLLAQDGVDVDATLQALAKIYKVPFIDLEHIEIDENLVEKCSEELCNEFCFIPVAISAGEMIVAIADPMDYAGMDVLQFKLGQRVRPLFSNPLDIQKKIRDLFTGGDGALDEVMSDLRALVEISKR
ncbi:MAG: hypothetical protein Q9N62_01215 [Ghiorsea sp.]|nr:hypothetical protein [Ghiorsea sp.]